MSRPYRTGSAAKSRPAPTDAGVAPAAGALGTAGASPQLDITDSVAVDRRRSSATDVRPRREIRRSEVAPRPAEVAPVGWRRGLGLGFARRFGKQLIGAAQRTARRPPREAPEAFSPSPARANRSGSERGNQGPTAFSLIRAVPCRAVPCRAALCRAALCRVAPCRAVPCRAVPRCAAPCRAVPRRAASCRVVPRRAASCRAALCRVASRRRRSFSKSHPKNNPGSDQRVCTPRSDPVRAPTPLP